MNHQGLRARIPQDVLEFLGLQVPIDGHRESPDDTRPERRLEEGNVIAHHQGDAVFPADVEVAEAGGRLRRTPQQLGLRHKTIPKLHARFAHSKISYDCCAAADSPVWPAPCPY